MGLRGPPLLQTVVSVAGNRAVPFGAWMGVFSVCLVIMQLFGRFNKCSSLAVLFMVLE